MATIDMSMVSGIISRLRKGKSKFKNAVTAGMEAAAEKVYKDSQFLVPTETSALKDSGKVTTKINGINTEVIVSYTAQYAIYVHENPLAAHGEAYNIKYAYEISNGWKGFTSRRPQEQFHFLSDPVMDLKGVKKEFEKFFI